MLNRRAFLKGVACVTAMPLVASCSRVRQTLLTSAATDRQGNHFMMGLDEQLQPTFKTALAKRGHGVIFNKATNQALAFARRPGRYIQVLDVLSNRVLHEIAPQHNRLFFGHGTFCAQGRFLYVTENDFEKARGVIGVYDSAKAYQKVDEFYAHGVGSHEIQRLAGSNTLVVANGGIHTHPEYPRQKLNLATMKPNLSFIDAGQGKLIKQQFLADHQASIRHIAVNESQVAVGLQHQSNTTQNSPICAYSDGEQFSLQQASGPLAPELKHYIASAALGRNGLLAFTAPRGNRVLFIDSQRDTLVGLLELRDVAGICYQKDKDRFYVSTGTGAIYPINGNTLSLGPGRQFDELKWDNHMALA